MILGTGDDAAAVIAEPGVLLLSTVDSQVEGVHFRWELISAAQLGHKLAAINLSDIAAMGGTPEFALINLSVPEDFPVEKVELFYDGLIKELDRWNVQIIGGNVSAAAVFSASLTLLGKEAPDHLKTRSGAEPGDWLCVTGSLGKGAAGFQLAENPDIVFDERSKVTAFWQTPEARIQAGQRLSGFSEVHAMIDVSDGLAGDGTHLCEAGRTGCIIFEDSLPIHPLVRKTAGTFGESLTDWALYGGEDYELLFAIDPGAFGKIKKDLSSIVPVTVIGEIISSEGVIRLKHKNGNLEPLRKQAWDHFRS